MQIKANLPAQELALAALLGATILLLSASSGLLERAYLAFPKKSPTGLGILLTITGLPTLVVGIWAAILVDRGRHRLLMPAGALLTAVGAAITAVVASITPLMIAGLFLGVGGAFTGLVIAFALVAKRSYRLRGTAIGLLASLSLFFGGSYSPSQLLLKPIAPQGQALLACIAALVAAIALLLFLPRRSPSAEHGLSLTFRRRITEEPSQRRRDLIGLPGFWKTALWIGAAFAISQSITAIATFGIVTLRNDSPQVTLNAGIASWRTSLAAGAFLWGILSDFLPVRKFAYLPALLTLPAIAVAFLIDLPVARIIGLALAGVGLGATYSLPWMLLADRLTIRHFATIGMVLWAAANILGSPLGGFLLATSPTNSTRLTTVLLLGILTAVFTSVVMTTPTLVWRSAIPDASAGES